MKLRDKVAVVTGGGRGIGRAICLVCARAGANVVIAAEVQSQVEDVAAEVQALQRRALAYRLDVVKPEEVQALQKAVLSEFGRVDVLVNSAGVVGKRAFIVDSEEAEWRRVIDVNLFGTYHCIKSFLPAMMAQREGRIINIASVSGKQASPTNAAYAASKTWAGHVPREPGLVRSAGGVRPRRRRRLGPSPWQCSPPPGRSR